MICKLVNPQYIIPTVIALIDFIRLLNNKTMIWKFCVKRKTRIVEIFLQQIIKWNFTA